MEPTRYMVAVGETAFHMRKRRGLVWGWVAVWAYAAAEKASRSNQTAGVRKRRAMGLLYRTEEPFYHREHEGTQRRSRARIAEIAVIARNRRNRKGEAYLCVIV